MKRFRKLFKNDKPVIGMIHIDPLPGTPNYKGNVTNIIKKALKEAEIYKEAGIDSLAIENMHDVPYLKRNVGHEITAIMSIIGYEIKQKTELPIGIQILAGANKQALAAAHSAGLDFIRAEGFIFSHVADEGLIESDAGELLRYRKQIGADEILIFTDIKKKHSSHSITDDISIKDTAATAEFFNSDGIIVTGNFTGFPADIEEIKSIKKDINLPVIAGSGINAENINDFFPYCDAFIVGSYFKKNGSWNNSPDTDRINSFIKKIEILR